MLTKYCKEKAIEYKQGMNEIMAAFVLLTREGLPKYMAYVFFVRFIESYVPTMFADNVFDT